MDELDNEEIWAQAENDVEKIINQAIKTVPVRTIRLNLENAKKQILLMSQLMARRNLTIRQVRWWNWICELTSNLNVWIDGNEENLEALRLDH